MIHDSPTQSPEAIEASAALLRQIGTPRQTLQSLDGSQKQRLARLLWLSKMLSEMNAATVSEWLAHFVQTRFDQTSLEGVICQRVLELLRNDAATDAAQPVTTEGL